VSAGGAGQGEGVGTKGALRKLNPRATRGPRLRSVYGRHCCVDKTEDRRQGNTDRINTVTEFVEQKNVSVRRSMRRSFQNSICAGLSKIPYVILGRLLQLFVCFFCSDEVYYYM
jgi:hypothetical protein